MKYDQQDDYDFAVSDISYVIRREPDPCWGIDKLKYPEHHILALPMAGKAHYRFDDHSTTVQKGDLLFFPKGFQHRGRSDRTDPWQFCYVIFDTVSMSPSGQDRLYELRGVTGSINLYEVVSLFNEMYFLWTAKRPGHLIRCRSIVMALLYHLIRARNTAENDAPFVPAIEKALAMIHDAPNRSFTTDQLSEAANFSPSYFRLLFKRLTGYSPVQYQNRVRINRAKDLLLSGECNVSESAIQVGFENIYYFSRLFKKVEGVSPSTYMRR